MLDLTAADRGKLLTLTMMCRITTVQDALPVGAERESRELHATIFTGGYFDYTGGKGKLTPTYRRLQRFVSSEAENAA
jgi:hypothetical protein